MDARDQVRLLIPDTDPAHQLYTNLEIDEFLTLQGANVRLAAAMALEVLASNEAFTQKNISILDVSTNGPATADSLMKRAALLRAEADAIDDNAFGIYAVVEDEDDEDEESEI